MVQPGYINITGIDLREFVRAAYDLSSPQGLGFLHAREGGLDDKTIDEIVGRRRISMDYVHGRSVKMHVRDDDGGLSINSQWYDHSTGQLKALLERVGLSPDLVDEARKAKDDYYAACRQKALEAVQANGGEIIESMDEHTDEDRSLGLFLLKEDGVLIEHFDYPNSRYTLSEPKQAEGER